MDKLKAKLIKDAKIARYSQKETVEEYYSERFDEPIGHIRDVVERKIVLNNTFGKVLDGGCGPGRFALRLTETKADVVGIDTSWEMLSFAASKSNNDKNISFVRGDLETLPFKDDFFDSVVSIRVLFHFSDYKNVVREFLRVLKPGGRIVVQLYSGDKQIRRNPVLKWVVQTGFYRWMLVINEKFFNLIRGKRTSGLMKGDRKGPAYEFNAEVSFPNCRKFLEKQGAKFIRCYTYDFPNSIWFKNRLLRGGGIINFILSFKPFFWAFYLLEIYCLRFLPAWLSHQYIIVMEKKWDRSNNK